MPISWSDLGAFTLLCVVLAATPGANLAVVLRCASAGGQRAAVAATVGLTVGKAFWASASLLGLAALLAASATAYNAVRLVGAGYLVWLGVQAVRAANRRNMATYKSPDVPPNTLTAAGGFVRGLIGDLLNPKVGLFYMTVFPHFIAPGAPVVAVASILLAAHTVVLIIWYPSVSYLLSRLGRILRRPSLIAFVDRVLGAALMALGARLAADVVSGI